MHLPNNILIIDSNPTFAKTLQQLIYEVTDFNANVTAALNVNDSLYILKKIRLDFIFLDLEISWLTDIKNHFNHFSNDKKIIGMTYFPENYPSNPKQSCQLYNILTKSQIEAITIMDSLNGKNY